MKIIEFGTEYKQKIVLALGYFDALHTGHRRLINNCRRFATRFGAECAALTFSSELKGKAVYPYSERMEILSTLVDVALVAPFDERIKSLTPDEFISILKEKYDIIAVVCGEDFRFGLNRSGDVKALSEGLECPVAVLKKDDASTSRVKELLQIGDVSGANALLAEPYFICGKVMHGRGVGRTLGFPTLNIEVQKNKFLPKNGVYIGYSIIDGERYASLINVGARPTFDLKEELVEVYADGYDGDAYGLTVKTYFTDFLREIERFDSVDGLVERLNKDKRILRGE